MPLSEIFDVHLIIGALIFFLLGFIVFPSINEAATEKIDRIIWFGIVAPVIGIACVIFGGVLIFIARDMPDEIIVQVFLTYLALFVVSFLGYVWHIISPDEQQDIEQSIKRTQEAIDQVIKLGDYSREKYGEVQRILNGDKRSR